MKFAFIAKHRHVWPVSWLCEALDVSRSGFHAWLRRGPSAREAADKGLTAEIRLSFVGSARTYGARRVWRDGLAEGFSCGLHKVERLMRMNALRARPRRRRSSKRRRRQIAVRRSQPSRSAIHRRATEPEVDRGLHIYLDGRGLALCCGGDRPLLAKSRRRVDESRDDRPTRHRCPRDGDLAAWKTRRSAASFRPGQPIYEQAVPAADGRSWRRLFNELVRQRLGQRCDGELLLLAQNREDRQKGVPVPRRGEGRRLRLHRAILQSDPQALDHRISQPR